MITPKNHPLIGLVLLFLTNTASTASEISDTETNSEAFKECLRVTVATAPDDATILNLKSNCHQLLPITTGQDKRQDTPTESAYQRREQLEKVTQFNPFVLSPFKANYFLPLTYHDSPNQASTGGNDLAQRTEFKFQLSVRFPVWQDVFGSGADLHFAYTGIAWWQAYDGARSRPFRETNHEPEAFLSFDVNWPFFGRHLRQITVGLNHQSNGQNLPTSRSWNRIITSFIWEYENRVMILRPWYRLPERARKDENDPRGDENPNIERYVGQLEFIAAWRQGDNTYSAIWKNNARAENRGSLELSWSFPLAGRARGYFQAFSGYGESLIDYDDHHNRLGLGILLTDWV